ncbi:MAG: hypothetical protein E6K80_09540 [Candidatus Eisenbacteria bacterium]|uniref:FlgD/Vpr Ig-like domain-containing protein n=1 Tax=Eiseniibacteriota bacterium TaxID=2212470 RepID=A0A538U2S0_UNCEI|nr:MAG: hypothetical protein E6K80_09540 [Candidatus Eisenbacteria bacterium]
MICASSLPDPAATAWAHVQATTNPAQNRIRMFWKFPCSGPPPVHGERDTTTRGNPPNTPPPDLVLVIAESDPEDSNNNVLLGAACFNDTTYVVTQTNGCATAGGTSIESTVQRPWAAVGLPSDNGAVASPSAMRVQVERLVVPGPAPDLLRLTLTGGGLRTQTFSANDMALATFKLIVYPDQATADADATQLSGAGSAFFGAVTLDGTTGSLVGTQGFSLTDFVVQNLGSGLYGAVPVTGLVRAVTVPDANTAVVSMVGDPKAGPSSTTGVSEPLAASGLWLGPAAPNPARGETRFRYGLPGAAHVSLAVFDQQGRRVRQLVEGRVEAGEHVASWDGRDTAGRQVPTALYFYRLDVEGRRLSGKVFALR